jgi:hypothetical protein
MKMKEMVRPEGLELSTFWFVERQEGQSQKSISFVWRRLRIGDVALPFFNCTESCTRAIHSGHLYLGFWLADHPRVITPR